MAKGIQANTPSGRAVYPDIIDLPHHQSSTHPHMSLYDRAAQFNPFAALTGYDDMIEEEIRETAEKREIEVDTLNRKIGLISSALSSGKHPFLSFTVFVPDERKAGGEYVEISGSVKKIDMMRQAVILYPEGDNSTEEVKIEHISDIRGELVDFLDDEVL